MKIRRTLIGIIMLSATLALSPLPAQKTSAIVRDQDDKNHENLNQNKRRQPGVVKITPLGSHPGEFCRNDRAFLFEDPTGVRILWDPGRTVDETDPRLGDIHLIVLSHAHPDHIGDAKPNPSSPGSCAAPSTISAGAATNLVRIAASKNSAVFVSGELPDYLNKKIASIKGATIATCQASGPAGIETTVPQPAPCTATLRPGGKRIVKLSGSDGVTVRMTQAFHSNGIPSNGADSPGVAPGTAAYGGDASGVILEFSNGLRVYCTGDTGLFGDMETLIKKIYQVDVVIANIGDQACMGPEEGAIAINELLTPKTVIPSHINEAATTGGQPTGYRLRLFMELVNKKTDVVLPLSGITRAFDGDGHCVNCERGR